MTHAVYRIINTETSHSYIGRTINYNARIRFHKCTLKKGTHRSKKMQQAFYLNGWRSFKFQIISEHKTKEDAMIAEAVAIKSEKPKYNSMENNNVFSKTSTKVISFRVLAKDRDKISRKIKKLIKAFLKRIEN